MALTPQEIAQARNWISTQWGGDGSLPGFGAAFNGDVYDPSNTQRNWGVLGAGQAMGYDANAMSQILGIPAADISAYGQANQVHSDTYADIFRADNHGVGQPAPARNTGNMGGSVPFTPNPWAASMGNDIQRRSNQALQEGLAGIRSNFVGSGGLGGDRQGIAEGVAIRGSMDNLQGNLANLFGGLYESDQNRGVTTRGQDMGFYTQQRGQDLQSIGLGADLFSRGMQGEWMPIQNAAQAYSPFTGFGSTTNNSNQGGGWQGAVGGALGAGQYAKNMGWW